MPAPKKFLSKAQRIEQKSLSDARGYFRKNPGEGFLDSQGVPYKVREHMLIEPPLNRSSRDLQSIIKEDARNSPAAKRGGTVPSSRVKKTKMSEQKLTKIGDAINTGLTPERERVLRLLSKLPREQMAKIFRALTEGGYAME
jgi:hypothetical protein